MASKKQKKVAPKQVTRQFLMDLARTIYDTKSRRFLRLCDGKLQNGPDPTNAQRPMHCGLGELYFAMTDTQPETDGVDEDEVVALAVELSPFGVLAKQARAKAVASIKALGLAEDLEDSLLEKIDDADDADLNGKEAEFREILGEIPGANDRCEGACDRDVYRQRSMRVARELRKAARLLPE